MAELPQASGWRTKRKVFCWQCGTLVLESYTSRTAYTCERCDCTGREQRPGDDQRSEYTRPGGVHEFRGITGTTYEPYLDFGPPSSATLMYPAP